MRTDENLKQGKVYIYEGKKAWKGKGGRKNFEAPERKKGRKEVLSDYVGFVPNDVGELDPTRKQAYRKERKNGTKNLKM